MHALSVAAGSPDRKIPHERRGSAREICPSGQNLLVRAAPFAMMEGTEIQGGRCDDKRRQHRCGGSAGH